MKESLLLINGVFLNIRRCYKSGKMPYSTYNQTALWTDCLKKEWSNRNKTSRPTEIIRNGCNGQLRNTFMNTKLLMCTLPSWNSVQINTKQKWLFHLAPELLTANLLVLILHSSYPFSRQKSFQSYFKAADLISVIEAAYKASLQKSDDERNFNLV